MNTLIGNKAPDFTLNGVIKGKIKEQISLSSLKGKYVILFFYPLDFTFVCPTEIHAFQQNLGEFEKRGVQLLACSTDSCYSHLAWMSTPRQRGGIEGIEYPILSDINKEISRTYGVLKEDEGVAYRGLFLIDKEGIVRHQTINDLPLGRSINETLRMIDALQCFEQNGEVCPANWKEGAKTMKTSSEGLVEYFSV